MNIVVLGCGAVLEQCHRRALAMVVQKLGARVVGLVDPNAKRLEMAKEWFPSAVGFTDAAECFSKVRDVSLTVVTTPPPLHAAHAELAFSHGSHVLCEKPLAGTVADAEAIVACARRHKRVLSLGMTRRYYSCLVEARRCIKAGALGNKLSFAYREGGIYNWPVASAAPFNRKGSGGGVLLDKGVHALDALCFIFGPASVGAHADDAPVQSVEANSLTTLDFGGTRGVMQLSWDMNLNSGLHVLGSMGEYWIPCGPLDLMYSRDRRNRAWTKVKIQAKWPLDLEKSNGKTGCPVDYNECFNFQLIQTLRAISLGESPAATGEEGLATTRLIAAAYEMATPMEKPWLSKGEQALAVRNHWRTVKQPD